MHIPRTENSYLNSVCTHMLTVMIITGKRRSLPDVPEGSVTKQNVSTVYVHYMLVCSLTKERHAYGTM